MSDGKDTGQEKSHEASARKLADARKKGDMPRSVDAQTAAVYLGFSIATLVFGGAGIIAMAQTLMAFLDQPGVLIDRFLSPGASEVALEAFTRLGTGLAPFLLGPVVLVLALLIGQRSIVAAPSKLKPKLSRINPIENAKQKYGATGLFEFAKSTIKLTAIAVILGLVLISEFERLPRYAQIPPRQIAPVLTDAFWNIMIGVLIFSIAVALIDIMWQRHSFAKKMRMTQQEVKDESKQSEGDPHVKASRRQRAREIANNRMLHDVAEADVVITNPTHYAVALKWSRVAGAVPICVAKGTDEMAKRIRMKAEQSDVAIHEDPPTARSIHALVEIGRMIEPMHYKAVAAAIVFADKLREKRRERSGGAA